MANPICNISSVLTTCYRSPGAITPKQQKALLIYAKMLQLKAIGGTDYTGKLTTTLLSDAATFSCGAEEDDLKAARIKIEFDKAIALGATVPETISAKQAFINCLVEADPAALDEADTLLTCKLGVPKAYPQ